jgi:hypothetical protein
MGSSCEYSILLAFNKKENVYSLLCVECAWVYWLKKKKACSVSLRFFALALCGTYDYSLASSKLCAWVLQPVLVLSVTTPFISMVDMFQFSGLHYVLLRVGVFLEMSWSSPEFLCIMVFPS